MSGYTAVHRTVWDAIALTASYTATNEMVVLMK